MGRCRMKSTLEFCGGQLPVGFISYCRRECTRLAKGIRIVDDLYLIGDSRLHRGN